MPKIKYLVIIGGAEFQSPGVAEKAYAAKIKCPSLHFIGIFPFFISHFCVCLLYSQRTPALNGLCFGSP